MKYFLVLVVSFLLCGMVSAQNALHSSSQDNFDAPERTFTRKVPRVLENVPMEHYPRPGECRIWYPDRLVGEQPPARKCDTMTGALFQEGAFILMYNGKAYDTEYNWKRDPNQEKEKERSGKIPQPVIDILFGS